jgi:teichoic acid glycerol-phosphate primase
MKGERMVRELLIWCYLTTYKVLNILFTFCSLQNKITFVISFKENAHYVYRELLRENPSVKIVLLSKIPISEDDQKYTRFIPYESKHPMHWILAVYHLSTSRVIIIDNYFGFLSALKFKDNVECIQIWHAAGAFKTFGLKDKSVKNRSKRAQRRFRSVYRQFHKIVVGSEEMANIFKEAFGVSSDNILHLGIPRTDFFYEEKTKKKVKANLYQKYPGFRDKKVILYAPTYRDGNLKSDNIHLDVNRMYEKLKSDFILLIKTHPAVKSNNVQDLHPGFVYNFSTYRHMNHLLLIADILITDYSSIPFEYALLQKPMIFFPYDYEAYKEERGLIEDYINVVPGPVVFDTDEVIELIRSNRFSTDLICEFSNKWNANSNGQSSKQLVTYILSKLQQ